MVISALRRLSAVGFSIAAAVLVLAGCSQPEIRPIGPDAAADVRGAAYKRVADATTIPVGSSAAILVGERFRDGCGLSPSAQFLQSDYTREFLCETGRVALYAVPTDIEIDAAGVVDTALLDMGCTTSNSLSSQISEGPPGTDPSGAPILTFFATYVCGSATVSATIGDAANLGFAQTLEQDPATIMNTPVVESPPLGATVLAAASEQSARYPVSLSTVDRYFTAAICRDLRPCSDAAD